MAIEIEDNDGSESSIRWRNGQVAIRIFDKKNVIRSSNNNKQMGKLVLIFHVFDDWKYHEIVFVRRCRRTAAKIAII